jgi:hypothetical protein
MASRVLPLRSARGRITIGLLVLIAAIATLVPAAVSADHQIVDVAVSSDVIEPGGAVDVTVTVETDGNVASGQNEWGSTAWGFAPNELGDPANCADLDPDIGAEAGTFDHEFSITAPEAAGEFELLLKISGPDDCGGGQASGIVRTGVVVTVVEVDLSIDDVEVIEGDSGTVDAVFTVSLSVASAETVTVDFHTADGTATAGDDYTSASDTLAFDPGETSKTITVAVLGDIVDEPDESLDLSGATNATIADDQGHGTILNDDEASLSIDDVEIAEGDSGSVDAVFTVSLSSVSTKTITVNFATANGSATAGDDYTAATGPLTFDPGETSETIAVPVLGDTLNEGNETFVVNLSGAVNTTIADDQGEGTILDDDGVTISIDDVSVAEGDSGTTNAVFSVSLSTASVETVTVNFATANGSAAGGSAYVTTSGTVTFTPGDTSEPVAVAVIGDTIDEANETFVVNLSGPVNATIADAQGVGTILDDDGVTISINNVSVAEGDSGTTSAVFTVTLSQTSSQTVTMNFSTANVSAVAGLDYLAASGSLSFAPGETSKNIIVAVIGDESDEVDETFIVVLSSAANATFSDNQGTGAILDDDAPSVISDVEGDGAEKVTICHIPPGNPENAHTISVGAPAVPAHEGHGDTLGSCP